MEIRTKDAIMKDVEDTDDVTRNDTQLNELTKLLIEVLTDIRDIMNTKLGSASYE